MRSIFLDLDGTLVNSQRRLYRLFCQLCPECTWTYDEYWSLKRKRITQAEMLRRYFSYDERRILAFRSDWLAQVEHPDAVSTDTPVPGMTELLARLSAYDKVVVLTCRQNRDLALRQLERFGWTRAIADVVATDSKAEYLSSVSLGGRDVLVGDTGDDIRVARRFGMKAVAVGWGILAPEVLAEYKPDRIVCSVSELERFLLGERAGHVQLLNRLHGQLAAKQLTEGILT